MTTSHTGRLRLGVIGAGLIAQVAHLPYLHELSDLFDTRVVCDLEPAIAEACAHRYGIARTSADWHEVLDEPLDAVIVLTSGSHAPVAIAAAERGLHVLVEKPMCLSVDEGRRMIAAAQSAGVILMVGYNKRYDLAYERFRDEVRTLSEPRLVRVTTFEAPFGPYVAHYPLVARIAPPLELVEQLRAETDAHVTAALGPATEFERRIYRGRLLDSLVHELNALRGLFGEPDRLDYADLRENSISLVLTFGAVPVAIHWIYLSPGIVRYRMEFAVYAAERRLTLSFPSPYLRNAPTVITREEGDRDTVRSYFAEDITAYESSFKRELIAFHEAVTSRREAPTSGEDALRDVALCQSIIEAYRSRRAIDQPGLPR